MTATLITSQVAAPVVVASPFNAPSTAIVVSEKRMIDMLSDIRGAEFITFIARTEPKMRKTGNPFTGRVVKVAKVNGQINFSYERAVLKQLEKEGKSPADFQQGESWHEAVVRNDGTLTPFCKHKTNGSLYLRFRLIGSIESEYRWANSDTPLTSAEVDQLKPFIVVSTYSNQGIENPDNVVKFLTYGFSSIKVLTMNKETFIIG